MRGGVRFSGCFPTSQLRRCSATNPPQTKSENPGGVPSGEVSVCGRALAGSRVVAENVRGQHVAVISGNRVPHSGCRLVAAAKVAQCATTQQQLCRGLCRSGAVHRCVFRVWQASAWRKRYPHTRCLMRGCVLAAVLAVNACLYASGDAYTATRRRDADLGALCTPNNATVAHCVTDAVVTG